MNRGLDERERPWENPRDQRERETGSLREWTREREMQMEREIAGTREPRGADRWWVATGEPKWDDFRRSRVWFSVGLRLISRRRRVSRREKMSGRRKEIDKKNKSRKENN